MSVSSRPLLVVVTGPTASGKTSLAIEIARSLGTEIISADSRQVYRDIPIITAAPTLDQQAQVRHYFVGQLPLEAYWSAALFAEEALWILPDIFSRSATNTAVVCGGSIMYVDALVSGIDEMPTISAGVRARVAAMTDSPDQLRGLLRTLDAESYARIDLANLRRVAHAVEVCLESGRRYSDFLTGTRQERPFDVITLMVDRSRDDLFARISVRTTAMLEAGMEAEARRVRQWRHLNSLNTVGFKEWFTYFDRQEGLLPVSSLPSSSDALTSPEAVAARIAKNTRVYAKKQLTYLNRRPDVVRLSPVNALRDALDLIARRRG